MVFVVKALDHENKATLPTTFTAVQAATTKILTPEKYHCIPVTIIDG